MQRLDYDSEQISKAFYKTFDTEDMKTYLSFIINNVSSFIEGCECLLKYCHSPTG